MNTLIKSIIKKLIKIISKHLFICILIAYTPLPFFDILNFYNQDDPLNVVSDNNNADNNQEGQDEDRKNKIYKLKVFLVVFGALVIFYILYKTNNEIPAGSSSGSAVTSKGDMSSILKAKQELIKEQILQKRMENALSTTRKILEIKKKV